MDSIAAPEDSALEPAIRAVRSIAEGGLSATRLAHCVGTAETARALCARYGLPPDAGYLAGLAHDALKGRPEAELEALARAFPGPLPPDFFDNPRWLHGPAAAVHLAREGIVEDPAVLEAVAYHTVGRRGMGGLALAVYVADKIEPGRRDWAAGLRRSLAEGAFDGDLPALAAAAIALLLDSITASGHAVAASTLILYNDLTGKNVQSWPEHA